MTNSENITDKENNDNKEWLNDEVYDSNKKWQQK